MSKIQIFLWQLCHKALPVRTILAARGIELDTNCPLCGQTNESLDHLFLYCPRSRQVWEAAESNQWIPSGLCTCGSRDIHSFMLWLHSHHTQLVKQHSSFLLWKLWKVRNEVVFNKAGFNSISCLIRAKRALAEWRIRSRLPDEIFPRGRPSIPHHKNHFIVRWVAPPIDFFKLNFDGSC